MSNGTTQSYEEEFKQIVTLFDAAWQEGGEYFCPIIYPNCKSSLPTTSGKRINHCRFFIENGDSEQVSMGGKDYNIYRHTGMVVLKIFTDKDLGELPGRILADKFCAIFRARDNAGICFKSPKMVNLGVTDDGYYQINCSCVFNRDSLL